MIRVRLMGVAGWVLAATLPSLAVAQESEPVEFLAVSDREEVVLDPAKTYLLIESPTLAMPSFIVMPTDEQQSDWARQRAVALAEAIERYPRQLQRYERAMERWRVNGVRSGPRPTAPVEPNPSTFPWPDLEPRRIGSTGPLNRFYKSDEVNLWLSEVPSGEYVFYGFGFGPNAVLAGTCMCMGSVGFAVEPGQITAVRVSSLFLNADGSRSSEVPEGSNTTDLMTRQVMLIEAATDAIHDPRLPRERMVRPAFEPIANLPNWFGGTIGRVEPIAGVLDYQRDRLIDLRPSAVPVAEMSSDQEQVIIAVESDVQPVAGN